MLHPGTKLRVIGLMPHTHDAMNAYLYRNSTNTLNYLHWIEETLKKAEKNKEKVIILNHFSPNSRFSIREYGIRMSALMERYANIIVGSFHGHEHNDFFELVNSAKNNSEYVQFSLINPSLTTYRGVNPSFRVIEFDPETYAIRDFITYRMHLDEVNARNKPAWNISYKFTEFFGLGSPSAKSLAEISSHFFSNKTLRDGIVRLYYQDAPQWVEKSQNPKQLRYIYCKLISSHHYALKACMNSKFPKISDYFQYIILPLLMPKWATLQQFCIQQQLN